MIDFSVNTSLNNAFSIDNEKIQTILSESLPLSEPSPLLPEGKFIYITVQLIKVTTHFILLPFYIKIKVILYIFPNLNKFKCFILYCSVHNENQLYLCWSMAM